VASWQCTNKQFDAKPCGNLVNSGIPPSGICSSCKKMGNWLKIDDGPPKLERQQGRMSLIGEGQARKNRLAKIINGLQEPSLEVRLAGEILRFIREVSSQPNRGWIGMTQDLERVKSRLRFAWWLYHNADYLAYELSPQSSWQLVEDLDGALTERWEVRGGLLGGRADHEIFASTPHKLREYGQKVIKETERIWRTLQSDEDREKFLYYVFEHDKGYNRIIEYLQNWEVGLRPEKAKAPDELEQVKGVGGLEKGGGKKGFQALATIFALQGDIRNGMGGLWKGRVFYTEEVGSYEMTDFDLTKREYTYKYLGPGDQHK